MSTTYLDLSLLGSQLRLCLPGLGASLVQLSPQVVEFLVTVVLPVMQLPLSVGKPVTQVLQDKEEVWSRGAVTVLM